MKKFIILLLTLIITVSFAPTFSVSAEESVSINSIKSVYELDSKIIGYPSVTTFIDDSGDMDRIALSNKTPAMAFLRLSAGAEVNVVDIDGKVIAPLYYVLQNVLKDKIIPAFYVADTQTAKAITNFIDENGIFDCTVVSPDGEILKSVLYYNDEGGFSRRRKVGGMLEISDATDMSMKEISEKASSFGARNVLVNIDDLDKQVLQNVKNQYRINAMTLYLKISGEDSAYRAIECGADAILVDNWEDTINVFESFDVNTLIKPIVVQAHRGMDVIYNENTLESVYAASLVGANTIEIDPRLSKDGQIVLIHDTDLGRITGYKVNGKVSDYTLEQLKAMDVVVNNNAQSAKICSLREVFELYKNYNLTTKLALDAKETNPQYVNILYELIEEFDAWDIIAGIGVADNSQKDLYIQRFSSKVSFNYVGSATVGGDKSDINDLTKNWLSVANSGYSAIGTLAPYYDYLVEVPNSVAFPRLSRIMKDRGIKLAPYQFDEVGQIEKAFLLDFANLSTGYSIYLQDFLNDVEANNVEISLGDTVNLTCKNIYLNGTNKQVSAEGFIIVNGQDVVDVDGANLFAKKSGTAKVMGYTTFTKGNLTYRVYTDILSVNVNGSSVRSDNVILKSTSVPQNNNSMTIIIICSVSAVVAAGAVVIFILIRRKKHGKN